jgi:hypothetical protein
MEDYNGGSNLAVYFFYLYLLLYWWLSLGGNFVQSESQSFPLIAIHMHGQHYAPTGGGNNKDDAVDPRTVLKPRLYKVSCLAYKSLLHSGEDQSILVSSESGAGRTETVKILLGNLASVELTV